MLHNNIIGTIEKMQIKVDIEDENEWHDAFEKVVGFQTPMPLDDGTLVVHTNSNPLIFKHGKFGAKLGQKCDHLWMIYNHQI